MKHLWDICVRAGVAHGLPDLVTASQTAEVAHLKEGGRGRMLIDPLVNVQRKGGGPARRWLQHGAKVPGRA